MSSIDVIHAQISKSPKLTHTITSKAEFEYGLCHVGDCTDLLSAVCCCPCYVGVLAIRMGENCLLGPLACLGFNSLATMRTKVREDYNIGGSILKDHLVTTCLPLCAARQMKHEMDEQEKRDQ